MKQFGLEGSGTCATNLPETMEDVMEDNGGREVVIEELGILILFLFLTDLRVPISCS